MYNKKQRLAALIGIILLVLLYLATLICAIFNFDGTGALFRSCLFATIAIPILIWVYIWLFGKMTGKKTIADTDRPEDTDTGAGNSSEPETDTVTLSKRTANKNKKKK